MEEAQKTADEQFKGSNGFEENGEDIDFKLSRGGSSGLTDKPRSIDESLDLQKLSENVLSQIARSNLTQMYARSEKECEREGKKGMASHISDFSDLPNHSIVSSEDRRPLIRSIQLEKTTGIAIEEQGVKSDGNYSKIRTQEDNLIYPRKYTRTFRLKPNANTQILVDKFTRFTKQNGFQTISEEKQNIWVRKAFSNNIFKLIFHFCCGVNSNIADYELTIHEDTIQLKLTGQSNDQSQKMMKEMEITLWKSQQLQLNQQDSLKFFIDSQNLNHMPNQLKYIVETEQHEKENGLELCLYSCNEQIEELMERFKLKCWNKELQPDSILMIEKEVYLSSQLWPIFKRHFQKQETKFVAKKRQIIHKMTVSQCFDYLQVDQPYRLDVSSGSHLMPYWQAIRILQRINYYITPKQKLSCLNSYYQTIQNCCKTYHGGRIILQTMDNILPILIYTLVFARCDNIYANIKLSELYLRQISVCEPALKMLANVFASTQYISNCWNPQHRNI